MHRCASTLFFLFVYKENSIFVVMKQFFNIVVWVFALSVVGCAADRSPRSLAKHFYKAIAGGEYDKALSYITLDEEIDLELYHAIMEKVSTSIEAKGGVEKIEIIDEQIAEDGMSAVVASAITYADGSVDKEYCDLKFKNEKWVIDVELYSK